MHEHDDECGDCPLCAGTLTKHPDLTIEEIEEQLRDLSSPASMDKMDEWIKTLPEHVQKWARDFPHNQLYRIKEGAPYVYTCAGCIVGVERFREKDYPKVELVVRVLRSPIGYAMVGAEVDPEWLEPITLDDLKAEVRKGMN